MPRILKFGTNVWYVLLYCVKENQHAAAYHSPYLSIFLSLQANFLLHVQISQLLREPESSSFVYTLRVAKYLLGQKTKLRFIMPLTSKKLTGHIGFGWCICPSVSPSVHSSRTVHARVLKFHIWIPHGKIVDAHFFSCLSYLPFWSYAPLKKSE